VSGQTCGIDQDTKAKKLEQILWEFVGRWRWARLLSSLHSNS